MFRDRFLQRMSKENFCDILRSYQIVPEQHRFKYVTEALESMKSSLKKPLTKKRSTSYLSSISEKKALIQRRIRKYTSDKVHWEKCLVKESDTIHPDREEKMRERIRSLDNKIKELERTLSRLQMGM